MTCALFIARPGESFGIAYWVASKADCEEMQFIWRWAGYAVWPEWFK